MPAAIAGFVPPDRQNYIASRVEGAELLSELGDPHGAAIGEHGANFQVGADGLEIAGERADIHVGAAFRLRHIAASDVQIFRNFGLRQLAGLP